MASLRDRLAKKAGSAGVVSDIQTQIGTTQTSLLTLQANLVEAQKTDADNDRDVAQGLSDLSTTGIAVDPNKNEDGSLNVLFKDNSPKGWHLVVAPSFDAMVPDQNKVDPPVTVDPNAPPTTTT